MTGNEYRAEVVALGTEREGWVCGGDQKGRERQLAFSNLAVGGGGGRILWFTFPIPVSCSLRHTFALACLTNAGVSKCGAILL